MGNRYLFSVVLLVLLATIPANAASVTIAYSGSVDMTFFGGPASSAFSGSATWDTNAVGFPGAPPNFGQYKLTGATFIINGVNYSALIDLTDHGGDSNADSHLAVNNAASGDAVFVTLFFVPGVDLGAGPDISRFVGNIFGPATMFSSTAVPQNLDFVPLLTPGTSFFNPFTGPSGSMVFASPAPEPSSALLIGTGVLSALWGFKRKLV